MASLSIFRDSHGGSPELVEFILSFLLTEEDKSKIKGGVYNSIFDYPTGMTKEYKVRETEFSLNVPTYILINEATFSAAEEFAFMICSKSISMRCKTIVLSLLAKLLKVALIPWRVFH